jgi:hypothetical protein
MVLFFVFGVTAASQQVKHRHAHRDAVRHLIEN